MNSDSYSLLFVFLLIVFVIFIFIRIALRIRKYGGSMLTTMAGSTHEFRDKEKQEAMEIVLDLKANKKMVEQSDDEPK